MNIKAGISSLILILICLCSLSGCSGKSYPFISFDDTIFYHEYEDSFGLAYGLKGYYVMYGKYTFYGGEAQAGEAYLVKPVIAIRRFRILDVLKKYPNLKDNRAMKAAAAQETVLKPGKQDLNVSVDNGRTITIPKGD